MTFCDEVCYRNWEKAHILSHLTVEFIGWPPDYSLLRSFTTPPLRVSTPCLGDSRHGRGGGRVEESSHGIKRGTRQYSTPTNKEPVHTGCGKPD